jgi:fucose 4-O-acetylase-like acetyltransferase
MARDNYFQAIRGICIIAVIFIHCSDSINTELIDFTMVCRQFINFPVAIFFFLSGYFTSFETDTKKQINRIWRIAVPYIFWFFVYLIYRCMRLHTSVSVWSFSKLFLTGGVSGQLYFLIALFQLQVITPYLVRILNIPPLQKSCQTFVF